MKNRKRLWVLEWRRWFRWETTKWAWWKSKV